MLLFVPHLSLPSPPPTNRSQYPAYLPTWNHSQKYPPLEPFSHIEHGKGADPTFKDLLPSGSKIQKLTPSIGSEVTGVQLSKLTKEGKDQLALLVAQRKVVAFRDQDFADLPLQEALDFGGYFGRHHIHPTSGSPEGFPELHSKLPAFLLEPLSDDAANYLDSRPSIRRHQQRFRILPREPQFQRLLALGRFL